MAEVLVFHHAHGLTAGVLAFADEVRSAGHTVHTADLFDGQTFDTLERGVEHAEDIGFDELIQRGTRAADAMPSEIVYAGFSLGVLPAQHLTQTRPGAIAALLFEACVPASQWGGWPQGVPVQVHGMDRDPFFAGEGDLDAARSLIDEAGATARAELFVYPGDRHLFADRSLASYEPEAAALLTGRVIAFLEALPR